MKNQKKSLQQLAQNTQVLSSVAQHNLKGGNGNVVEDTLKQAHIIYGDALQM